MAERALRNVSHSVFARLKGLSNRDRDFNRLLQRFTAERFLYRLSISPEADSFTLKGATLFLVWCGEGLRTTRDVDLVRSRLATPETLRRTLEAICAEPCPEDGIAFSPEPSQISDLPLDPDQPGRAVRAKLKGTLGNARLSLQVDVGFEDTITPGRQRAALPTLLDLPEPTLWTYPRETAVAEKLHAMARFGRRFTRIKDVWDVAALAVRFPFDGRTLRLAVDHTFGQRGTMPTDDLPVPLQDSFYGPEREVFWAKFHRTSTVLAPEPRTLAEAVRILREFLEPVWQSAVRNEPFDRVWPPGGPWRAAGGHRDSGDG